MTLKSIASLKFVVKPTSYNKYKQDPVITRRSNLVVGLNKQLDLLAGKDIEEKIRPWFTQRGNGFVAAVRYRNSPIELDGTNAFFEVANKSALINIYKSITKEANAGEWDSILEKKSKSMKLGGRKKPPVSEAA